MPEVCPQGDQHGQDSSSKLLTHQAHPLAENTDVFRSRHQSASARSLTATASSSSRDVPGTSGQDDPDSASSYTRAASQTLAAASLPTSPRSRSASPDAPAGSAAQRAARTVIEVQRTPGSSALPLEQGSPGVTQQLEQRTIRAASVSRDHAILPPRAPSPSTQLNADLVSKLKSSPVASIHPTSSLPASLTHPDTQLPANSSNEADVASRVSSSSGHRRSDSTASASRVFAAAVVDSHLVPAWSQGARGSSRGRVKARRVRRNTQVRTCAVAICPLS